MIQSLFILEDRSHWIHSVQMYQDDTIPQYSRGLNSMDLFWTDVSGWYNLSTFSRTEVTGSILDRCPRMINLSSFSSTEVTESLLDRCRRMIQSLLILEDRGLQITLGQMPRDDTIPLQHHYSPFQGSSFRTTPSVSRKCSNFTWDRGFISKIHHPNHHHLHLQYVNTESIIIYIFSIEILKASSSLYSV